MTSISLFIFELFSTLKSPYSLFRIHLYLLLFFLSFPNKLVIIHFGLFLKSDYTKEKDMKSLGHI